MRRGIFVLIASTAVGAGLGYLVTPKTHVYRSTAIIYVGPVHLTQDPTALYLLQQLNEATATYAGMIPHQVIASQAIKQAGLNRSVASVISETTAFVYPGTSLIAVQDTDRSSTVSAALATAMAHAFVAYLPTLQSADPAAQPQEPAYVYQDATRPRSAVPTPLRRRVILGAVFGLVI
jgi:capsular polysaccharide biosynthesis protein